MDYANYKRGGSELRGSLSVGEARYPVRGDLTFSYWFNERTQRWICVCDDFERFFVGEDLLRDVAFIDFSIKFHRQFVRVFTQDEETLTPNELSFKKAVRKRFHWDVALSALGRCDVLDGFINEEGRFVWGDGKKTTLGFLRTGDKRLQGRGIVRTLFPGTERETYSLLSFIPHDALGKR